MRSGFVGRLFVDIGFSLTIVRNVSIISTITGSGISHSLNSAIRKENTVFATGRASISGLRMTKIYITMIIVLDTKRKAKIESWHNIWVVDIMLLHLQYPARASTSSATALSTRPRPASRASPVSSSTSQ